MHLRSLAVVVVGCGWLSLAAGQVWAAEEHTKETPDEVRAKVEDDKAVLFDVREQAEWDAGHLADAVLLPLSQLKDKLEDPEFVAEVKKKIGDKSIVYCHCRAGRRALTAAELLKKLGYDARALKPGYQELLNAGFKPAE